MFMPHQPAWHQAVKSFGQNGSMRGAIAACLFTLLLDPGIAFSQEWVCPHEGAICQHTEDGSCSPNWTWTVPCGCGGDTVADRTNPFVIICGPVGYGGGLCPDQQLGCALACTATVSSNSCFPVGDIVESERKKEPSANQPPSCMGEPVSLTTGGAFFTHTDAVVGSLVLSRTFHSRRLGLTSQGQ